MIIKNNHWRPKTKSALSLDETHKHFTSCCFFKSQAKKKQDSNNFHLVDLLFEQTQVFLSFPINCNNLFSLGLLIKK